MKRFISSRVVIALPLILAFATIVVCYRPTSRSKAPVSLSGDRASIPSAPVEPGSIQAAPAEDRTTASKNRSTALEDIFRDVETLSRAEARAILQQRLSGLSEEESKKAIIQLVTDPKLAELQDLVATVANSWMERDLTGFLTWVKQSFDDEKSSQVVLFSMKNLTASQAGPFWSALAANWKEEQTRFVSPIAEALAEKNPAEAFVAVGDLFSNAAHRQEARMAVVEKWGLTAPQDALAALQTLSPDEGRDSLAATIFAAWGDSDLAAVESFLTSSSLPLSLRQTGVAVIAEMRAVKDPLAAKEWLASLPKETVGADALVNLSQNLFFTDRARAMEVAAQIQEPSLRSLQVSELFSSWAFEDPAGAQTYIQQHPLADANEQRRLLSETRPTQAEPNE